MDASAIKQITDTALVAEGHAEARLPDHMVMVPDSMKLVDLEKNLLNRTRYRGAFATQSLPDFVAYVLANVSTPAQPLGPGEHRRAELFIDADKHMAKVFFNLADLEGNPGHGDWTASLQLKATAAYSALCNIEGVKLTQRALIDWLEDWGRNVTRVVADSGDLMTLPAAIAAFRKLTIASKTDSTHVQDERRATRSAMEEVEAKAAGQFPDRIGFTCVPYLGLPSRDFELRVGVLTDHEDPRIVLRLVQKEEHQEAIAQDFKDEIGNRINGAVTLTVGTFAP